VGRKTIQQSSMSPRPNALSALGLTVRTTGGRVNTPSRDRYAPKSATQINCGWPKCRGILWNISSRLAMALGITTLQCDECKRKWGVKK